MSRLLESFISDAPPINADGDILWDQYLKGGYNSLEPFYEVDGLRVSTSHLQTIARGGNIEQVETNSNHFSNGNISEQGEDLKYWINSAGDISDPNNKKYLKSETYTSWNHGGFKGSFSKITFDWGNFGRDLKNYFGYTASTSNSYLFGSIDFSVAFATILKYSPNSPFYMADAAFSDLGWQFVGGEGDYGEFLILSGKDLGKVIPYDERAGGASNSITFGFEFGRIDTYGAPFQTKFLKGDRFKIGIGGSTPIISAGGSFTSSLSFPVKNSFNVKIISTGVSFDFGFNLPGPSLLFNYGNIRLK